MKFCHHPGIHYMGISLPFSVSCISKSFPVKTLKIKNGKNFQRFYTLVVVTVKITIFWDVTPYTQAKIYQCFRGTCCLQLQGKMGYFCNILNDYLILYNFSSNLMMEATGTYAMLVKFVITARDAMSKNTIFSHCHKKRN